MKQVFLFGDFKPQFCCGVEVAVAVGVGAAIAGVAGSAMSASAQREANAINQANFDKSLEFNEAEAQKSRDFTSDESEKNREWQEKMYDLQYRQNLALADAQRQWDSIGNQAKLAKEAGFNASVALGNGSFGSGATFDVPSVPTVSNAPSVPSAQSPSLPNVQSVGGAIQTGFTNLSQLLQALGSYDKNSAESHQTRSLLQGYQELLGNQVYGAQMDNACKSVELIVKKNTALTKELNNLQLQYYEGLLKLKQGELFDSEKFLNNVKAFGERCKGNLDSAKTVEIYQHIATFAESFSKQMELFDAQIKGWKASANSSNAQAGLFRAQTQSEDVMREWKVEYEKYHSLIEKSTHTVLNSTEMARMEEIVNHSINSGIVNKVTEQQLRNAIKNNDWYEVGRIMNAVGVLAGVGIALKR